MKESSTDGASGTTHESRMRVWADAFRTVVEGAPLDISLAILSRAVTAEIPEARAAFYVADLDVARIHPIRGEDETLESFGSSWTFPIEASDGKSMGVLALYLPQARDVTEDDRELVDTITHAAGVIISHYSADRQRVQMELSAQQRALLQVEGLVKQRTAERDELRRQLARVEEAERRRLSRELHDQLGQDLTAFRLLLDDVARIVRTPAPRRVKDNTPLFARIEQLQGLTQRMMLGAKYISLELRPPELDDVGFESALDTYVSEWSARYGIAAEMSVRGTDLMRALSDDVASAFYRIAQEALTNVAKHAQARNVSVIVDKQRREVRMVIEDDGRGFDAATQHARREKGHGIAGMRERAALAGGQVEVESGSHGTTVYVHAPLA